MNVADNNLVCSLIDRFHFPHAKRDETCFAICYELETATFKNFWYSFVEFERWCWITFDLYRKVSRLVYWKKYILLKTFILFCHLTKYYLNLYVPLTVVIYS